MVRARRRPGRARRRLPRPCTEGGRCLRRPRRRARGGDGPRCRGVRRRRAGVDRPTRRILDPLRPHVVRRRRHGAVGDAGAGRRPPARSRRRPRVGHEAPRVRVRRGPDRRPHARDARRAHDVRHQARPRLPAGGPRPHAPSPRTRVRRGREALGSRRHIRQHRAGGRGLRLQGARAAARSRHPGHCEGPPRRVSVRLLRPRHDRRIARDGDPAAAAHRGGRGRGAVRRRPERLVVDAAQAQPDHCRASRRSGPGVAWLPRRRPRRRGALAGTGHLPQLGREDRAPGREPGRLLRCAEG